MDGLLSRVMDILFVIRDDELTYVWNGKTDVSYNGRPLYVVRLYSAVNIFSSLINATQLEIFTNDEN